MRQPQSYPGMDKHSAHYQENIFLKRSIGKYIAIKYGCWRNFIVNYLENLLLANLN